MSEGHPPMREGCRGQVLSLRHSPAFTATWRDVLGRVFGWPHDGPFAVVRGVTGGRVYSCLPHLNSTHMDRAAATAAGETLGGKDFVVRILDPELPLPANGAPVTMRVAMEGRTSDAAWRTLIGKEARNRVRRAQKKGFVVQDGTTAALAETFDGILARTLHRHGAPRLPATLVPALIEALEADVILVRDARQALAGLVLFHDTDLAWTPWVARLPVGGQDDPGILAYWRAMEIAAERGAAVLDFGRSPMGGGTYRFKRKWGAEPVPLAWVSSRPVDPYGQFRLAQSLWRRLPRRLADSLGPVLCRHLPEY